MEIRRELRGKSGKEKAESGTGEGFTNYERLVG